MSKDKSKKPKKYKSLTEFALFGKDDEEIDLHTLVATKKKPNNKQPAAPANGTGRGEENDQHV